MTNGSDALRHRNGCKSGAAGKRLIADGNSPRRNSQLRQRRTGEECPLTDLKLRTRTGEGNRPELRTTIKRALVDRSHVLADGNAGQIGVAGEYAGAYPRYGVGQRIRSRSAVRVVKDTGAVAIEQDAVNRFKVRIVFVDDHVAQIG